MNCYATLPMLKARLGITDTGADADLLAHLEAASRQADNHCGRRFWSEAGARYYSAQDALRLELPDDLLSLTELARDASHDGTYGEIWTAADYLLTPLNGAIKWTALPTLANGLQFEARGRIGEARLTGVWGYGDGARADPWDALGLTVSVADGLAATVTPSADGLAAGQTIRVGAEQMYVSAATAGTGRAATVARGVNGTTPAAHGATAAMSASYPPMVAHAALWLAARHWSAGDKGHLAQEQLGDGRWVFSTAADEKAMLDVWLAGYARIAV
jgi:hypothetical protein